MTNSTLPTAEAADITTIRGLAGLLCEKLAPAEAA
jgi:hypothetical protein